MTFVDVVLAAALGAVLAKAAFGVLAWCAGVVYVKLFL